MKIDKCELCGTPCKVVGNTTKHYEPIITLETILEGLPKEHTTCFCDEEDVCCNCSYNQALADVKEYLRGVS